MPSSPPPNLRDWLSGEEMPHLECRRWGHLWEHLRHEEKPERGVLLRTIQRCKRCHCDRIDDQLSGGGYDMKIKYADGYLMPEGMGRLTREDRLALRLETTRRIREELRSQPKSGRTKTATTRKKRA